MSHPSCRIKGRPASAIGFKLWEKTAVKRYLNFFLIIGMVFFFCKAFFAQPEVVIAKVEKKPVIDGLLKDDAWKKASVFSEFSTMHPEPGLAPSGKTKVYIKYSETDIFIGFECYDSEPDKIQTGTSVRDNPSEDD